MTQNYLDYYIAKVKKGLKQLATWVTIIIIFFVLLFNLKSKGATTFWDYFSVIFTYLIIFCIVHFIFTYFTWKKKR